MGARMDPSRWPGGAGTRPRRRGFSTPAVQVTGVVSGTVAHQGRFYDRFHHVVLLGAPLDVLLDRVARRLNNPYGKTAEHQWETARHENEVEPLFRRGATLELDGRRRYGKSRRRRAASRRVKSI